MTERTPPELSRLIEALEEFRKLDAEMPVQKILTFLTIAKHPDMSMTELKQLLDLSTSSMSRNILDFSKTNRDKKPGFDYISYVDDPVDTRKKLARINSRGRQFLARILAPLQR